MKVLLVDADSTIPNLALMKLSAYHKSVGDDVDLMRLNIPYYQHKKKKHHYIDCFCEYEKIYCSVIFDGSIDYIHGVDIDFGGTGFSLKKDLPIYIESLNPDYSIYPDNNISYGFISRGCIRKCYFCKVPEKEGMIRQVNCIDDIAKHKTVKFMDNNFLALPNHKDLLQELINKKIKCSFNQGLDIRLIDVENSKLLSLLNYHGEYYFSFDNWKSKALIQKHLKLLTWHKDWGIKFFIYINKKMPLSDTIERIKFVKEKKLLPYIMRDQNCWESEYVDFYTDIAAWCNQPGFFKKMTFSEFLNKRHKNKERIDKSFSLFYNIAI